MPSQGLGLSIGRGCSGFRFQGLLDLFPGAQFVTSTSLLRYDLHDSWLQQIRRSSDNDAVLAKPDLSLAIPSISLNSPLVGSSSTLGQFISSNSGFVAASREQTLSDVGYPVQADITKQPRIINNGVLESLNGRPAMVFDGADDNLITPTVVINAGEFSTFIVLSQASGLTGLNMWLEDNTSTRKEGLTTSNRNTFIRVVNDSSNATSYTVANTPFTVQIMRDSSNKVDVEFNTNGLVRHFSDTAQIGNRQFNCIGGRTNAQFWNGKIAEIINYPINHSNRLAINAYQREYFGVV